VGDVVVSMDFENGGVGSISVHDWNGTDYVQVGDSTGEGCNGADTICAFNNGRSDRFGLHDAADRRTPSPALAVRHPAATGSASPEFRFLKLLPPVSDHNYLTQY
jgi:hypothetical protein